MSRKLILVGRKFTLTPFFPCSPLSPLPWAKCLPGKRFPRIMRGSLRPVGPIPCGSTPSPGRFRKRDSDLPLAARPHFRIAHVRQRLAGWRHIEADVVLAKHVINHHRGA
ncbi:hypothetical protein [Thermomonas sp.]